MLQAGTKLLKPSLQDFARFIKNNHIEQFLEKELTQLELLNTPLLKKLEHLPKEQFLQIARESAVRFITALCEGRALENAIENIRRWENDELGFTKKQDVIPTDFIYVYSAQKQALQSLLPLYTTDIKEAVKIIDKLEEYFREISERAVSVIVKNKEELNSRLIDAQIMNRTGSFEHDVKSGKVFCSPGVSKIYETSFGEWITHETINSFTHPEDRDLVASAIERAHISGEQYHFHYRIILPNKQEKIILARGEVINDAQGKKRTVKGTMQDVTELMEQKRLNDKKDEFIGIASHELKTPLTSIKAYVQLLDRNLPSESRKAIGLYINKTQSHISRLEKLINDFLDVSKATTGKLNIELSNFSFDEMVLEAVDSIRKNQNTHTIILQGKTQKMITADKHRLEQVIYNLISNAIKYSPGGNKVLVNTRYFYGKIIVSVQDFGIGIPKEALSHIFNRFYRLESTSSRFQGMGIGLYIASEIIKQHNGRIWAESEVGSGTTFHVSIPWKHQH